ncbi:MAG: TetR/AcrR family transcriptional regulator [Alphaproteobacteria bacterium]|nr:MAG: TetR/AcrR family transcriptional regulator [Alphaproteobacteria bacterium]
MNSLLWFKKKFTDVKTMTEHEQKRQKILAAALELAAKRAWESVSLLDIARKAGVPHQDITAVFPQKYDITSAVLRDIDDRMSIEDLGLDGERDSLKDRLFEIVMFRFDLLAEDREAMVSMLKPAMQSLEQAAQHKQGFCHSMRLIIEKAEMDCDHVLKEDILIAALGLVYMMTVRIWLQDDSPDMTRTMAALDRYLERMLKILPLQDRAEAA